MLDGIADWLTPIVDWNGYRISDFALTSITQIQDQTLNAVPKIIAMVIALIVCLPWLTDRMIEYSRTAISEIPELIHR